MAIRIELIDELIKDYKKPEDIMSENDILKQPTKAILGQTLSAELTHHSATRTTLLKPKTRVICVTVRPAKR